MDGVQFGSSLPHVIDQPEDSVESLRSKLSLFSLLFCFVFLRQEIKCDFHIFSLSLSFPSMNVISIPLLAQCTGHVPGAFELAFLKC